jgi:Lrp/AsnC family leucine-responsive transcriptional regulator
MIDEIDLQILELLQTNARISNAEMARHLGMAPSAVLERVRKLEVKNLLQGYHARLDPGPLGLGLLAFVFVRANEPPGRTETAERLARLDNVLEIHHIAGEDCFLVKVRARDTEDLGRLLMEEFGSIETVGSTRTTIVLGTLKDSTRLPLPVPDQVGGRRATG